MACWRGSALCTALSGGGRPPVRSLHSLQGSCGPKMQVPSLTSLVSALLGFDIMLHMSPPPTSAEYLRRSELRQFGLSSKVFRSYARKF